LFEALHAPISQRVPLHIWGACGVGKSQIVDQVAADLNYQFLDIRAVQLDPADDSELSLSFYSEEEDEGDLTSASDFLD
jgi:shikimate kinase